MSTILKAALAPSRGTLSAIPHEKNNRKRKGEEQVDETARKLLAMGENSEAAPSENFKTQHDEFLKANQMCVPSSILGDSDGEELHFDKKIGQGSFGTVFNGYRLKDEEAEEEVAIKVCAQEKKAAALKKEFNTLKELEQEGVPHCIRAREILVFDHTCEFCPQTGDIHALVLPLCKGSLADLYVRKGLDMPFERIQLFLHQLTSVLVFLQRKGWIHRDIKPANIMVTQDGNYVLGDWGLSVKTECVKKRGPAGTLKFFAPEMLLHNEYDCRVDSWAAAVSLYILIVRQAPFTTVEDGSREDEALLVHQIKEELRAPPADWVQSSPHLSEPLKGKHKECYQLCRTWAPLPDCSFSNRLAEKLRHRRVPAPHAAEAMNYVTQMLTYKRRFPTEYIKDLPILKLTEEKIEAARLSPEFESQYLVNKKRY